MPAMTTLTLVSHHLCPYVQRAAIALAEKDAKFTRIYVDLSAKPQWFLELSPLGKVPLLRVADMDGREDVLFESAVICEYLDDTIAPRLHPADPIARAKHRAWVEFASAVLNDIAGLYNAPEEAPYTAKARVLRARFERLEGHVAPTGPYVTGERFSLVDAAFAPVFRYFDAFEQLAGLSLLSDLPRVKGWRAALAGRPSVKDAVAQDYPERLASFLQARGSHFSTLLLPALAA
jgi:glutathione S-transferase